jgi:type I restriction enzyme S subunit
MRGPWSDGVPDGWQVRPLWSEFRRGKTLGDGSEELLSVYRDYGVIPKSSREDNFNKPSEDLSKYQRVSVGDLVVNKMKAWQGSLGVSNHDGIVSPAYFVYKATGTFDRRFAHYLLRSKDYAEHMGAISSGIRPNQWDLDPAQFTVTPLLVPPSAVQRAIAEYLDRETAQIDAFIAKNEELITLLTERRVAAIDARILKSGANRIALQRVLRRIRQGWSPNCENSPADGISDWGVLKVGCSNTGQFDPRENKKLPASEKPRPDLVVAQDEIVMSRSNTRELVGAAAVVSAQYPRLMLSDLTYGITVRSEILPEYLAWQLRGRLVRGQIETAAKGTSSSMQKLSQRDIRELQIMCPPMAEQRAVVDDLNRLAAASDSARQASLRAIELARERRAALISAAVTGKIDVGVAA